MIDRRTVTTDTLAQAGKVIAVHINYPSRAAERGRTPEQPSYFLKPGTSLALTGAAWNAQPAANCWASKVKSR